MSVLQPWLEQLPIRMQSTLILSLRGPDTHACPGIKSIQRWMRGLTFKPGNPDNTKEFMHYDPAPITEKNPAAKELEFCTQHFYSHLLHGLEVLAYRHPLAIVRAMAFDRFHAMCGLMHLDVESRHDFELRLCDKAWPGGAQPRDFDEAIALLAPKEEAH